MTTVTPIQAALDAHSAALAADAPPAEAARAALAAFDAGGEPLKARVASLVLAMAGRADAAGLRRDAVFGPGRPAGPRLHKLALGLHALCLESGIDFGPMAAAQAGGGPAPRDYAINVRAVVLVTERAAGEGGGEIPGWEVYDTDATEVPGRFRVACDQLVRVAARSAAEAIALAKAKASPIAVDWGEIDDVSLWVDEAIDIDPEFAEAPGAPAPRA